MSLIYSAFSTLWVVLKNGFNILFGLAASNVLEYADTHHYASKFVTINVPLTVKFTNRKNQNPQGE